MEQEKKLTVASIKKNYRFGQRLNKAESTYKSNVAGLEEDTFDVGASSNPDKLNKSLKSIAIYVQRTYKMPDGIVKAI